MKFTTETLGWIFMGIVLVFCIALFTNVSNAKTIVLTKDNTIVLRQAFTGASVAQVQQDAFTKAEKVKELYLFLRTPGGIISAGQSLIDSLNALPIVTHTITSFAASMGYNTVQLLKGKRYILPSGILMSHRAYGGFEGQIPGELNTQLKFFMDMMDEKDTKIAKRIGLTLDQYKMLVWNEYWVSGKAAIQQFQADAIVDVRCDKTLRGSSVQSFQTFFGDVEVTFADCPLINAPLKIDFSKLKLNPNNQVEREKLNEIRTFFTIYTNDLSLFTKQYIINNKFNQIIR
jgi:ATP-dependent protease ClpP protease subunit